jgi:electron transfer flavoprotein alpha/beta subunit
MKTMTKLLNLGRVSVKANIAKLCYAVAKTTINLNSPIVISMQTNATESRYVGAKTMTKLNNKTIATVETR